MVSTFLVVHSRYGGPLTQNKPTAANISVTFTLIFFLGRVRNKTKTLLADTAQQTSGQGDRSNAIIRGSHHTHPRPTTSLQK